MKHLKNITFGEHQLNTVTSQAETRLAASQLIAQPRIFHEGHFHQFFSHYGNIFRKFWTNFNGIGITPSYFPALMKWSLLVLPLISWHYFFPLGILCQFYFEQPMRLKDFSVLFLKGEINPEKMSRHKKICQITIFNYFTNRWHCQNVICIFLHLQVQSTYRYYKYY